MDHVLQVANSPAIWGFAIAIIVIVFLQAIQFLKLAKIAGKEMGIAQHDVRAAIRTGAISSIGPSLAIVIIAISLLTLIGDPVTLMRIGIVGSAPIETVGATLGAEAAGAQLGTSTMTMQAFTAAVWVMCLGGTGWLLFVLLFTPSLGKIQAAASKTETRMTLLKIISSAAMIGAFANLGAGEFIKSSSHAIVFVFAFLTMPLLLIVANRFNFQLLKEWALGIVILGGLLISYFIA